LVTGRLIGQSVPEVKKLPQPVETGVWLTMMLIGEQLRIVGNVSLDNHAGGGRCKGSLDLCTSHTLSAERSNIIDDVGGLVGFASHGVVEGGAVQQVVNEKQKT
jgi:hypothetical protein